MGRGIRLALFVALGATIAATLAAAAGSGGPSGRGVPFHLGLLRIDFPAPGSSVSGGTLAVAELARRVPRFLVKRVDFHYAAPGQRFRRISGVAPFGMREFAALWDVAELPGGEYRLRARVVPRFGAAWGLVDEILVVVNEEPVAVVEAGFGFPPPPPGPVEAIEGFAGSDAQSGDVDELLPLPLPPPREVLAILDASASFDPDGEIAAFLWRLGDGFEHDGPIVELAFGEGSHGVSVTVTDDLGGQDTAHFLVEVAFDQDGQPSAELRDKESCGCEEMTVRNEGALVGPDDFRFLQAHIPGVAGAERRRLGPFGGSPGDTLDPRRAHHVRHRFEVVADLAEGSEPALCAEGQRRQGSIHARGADHTVAGNRSSDPRYDSSLSRDDPYDPDDRRFRTERSSCAVDDEDGEWCDDDYHGGRRADGTGRPGRQPAVRSKKRYDDQDRILWIDGPGFRPIEARDWRADGATFRAKFEAAVTGELGGCECSWEVLIEVDRNGAVRTNELSNLDCSSD